MSRARNIKPGFFKNELLVELPFECRLLFIGLWTMADRAGRMEDRPTKIKMELFPADMVDVNAGIQALHDNGFVRRYEVDGRRYIQVLAWGKHQNPHVKEAASTIPAPVEHGASMVQALEIPERAGLIPDSGFLIPDSKEKATVQQAALASMPKGAKGTSEHFNRVWAVYPVKKGKADAERHWKTHKLDPMADAIIAHIRKMEAEDEQWKQGFIPHGSTYFCGKRWEDEPTGPTSDAKPHAKPPAPETFGAAAALKTTETPLERDLAYARQRFDRGEFDSEDDYRAAVRKIRAEYGVQHGQQ